MHDYILWGQPFQMWFVFIIIIVSLIIFATEKLSMELTSMGIVIVLLAFFNFFPVLDDYGKNIADSKRLLSGLSNPAMVSVLALLVIGQGIVRTGILDTGARLLMKYTDSNAFISFTVILTVAMISSGFLNNIPIVVIFIPILQSMCRKFNIPATKIMMSLGFVAVLGGMTTIVGSGTNLLVNTALISTGLEPLGFFDITVPGLVLAFSGLAFCLFILPLLIPERKSNEIGTGAKEGQQFLVELEFGSNPNLIGMTPKAGMFPDLPRFTILSIQKINGKEFLPPFEDYSIEEHDRFLISTSRENLRATISENPWLIKGLVNYCDINHKKNSITKGDPILMNAMVVPNSNLIGKSLSNQLVDNAEMCEIIGIKRRASLGRHNIRDAVIESGDVLLMRGQRDQIENLRMSKDVVPLEWSSNDLPQKQGALPATLIFLVTMLMTSTGILPVEISALIGATAMVIFHILTPKQVLKALDIKVALAIIAAIALGESLNATGGADWLAVQYINLIGDVKPGLSLSIMFIIIAALSTIITTKTAAVLFTPAVVQVAVQYDQMLPDQHIPWQPFAMAVIFAANCSFANPLGYKTNLLTMKPGNYRFLDYARAGIPLTIFLWIVFSLFVPAYFGLPLF